MSARPVACLPDDGERHQHGAGQARAVSVRCAGGPAGASARNLTDLRAQVVTSAAAGLAAGAAINFDLVTEDAGRAVGSYPRSA